MKTNLYFAFLGMLFLGSCNRDSDDKKEPTNTQTDIVLTLSTTRDISNLQVDEKVEVNFDIKDKDTVNVNYIIRPETDNKVFHQRLDEDYFLQVEKQGLPYLRRENKVVLNSQQQKGKFYIYILKPGSFQHNYILEKYVNGEKVAETKTEFIFNAVKITAWTYSQQVVAPDTNSHSRHRRYWKFNIDDGSEKYDTYLENINGKTHSYTAKYNNKNYTEGNGNFSSNTEIEFAESVEQKKSSPSIPSLILDEIIIQQKQPNGSLNNITYKNIPVEAK